MIKQSKEDIQRHIRTHSEHSAEDSSAICELECFLRSGGRINTNFSKNDKWPNHDGTFELVPNPDISRQPTQAFYVQIKGTHNYREENGSIKYSLKSLAFLAYVAHDVTLDPCILFVVLNPDKRNSERVFWKYISVDLLNSIDFTKGSATICFTPEDEILNSEESIISFCKKLEEIKARHLFVSKLSSKDLSEAEIIRIINTCNAQIVESIDSMSILNLSRDGISQRILPRLNDMCTSALLLNSIKLGMQTTNLQLAWEQAVLRIETKYLATFLKGLRYIDNRIPEDGQSERLMLKYYDFLWQIRAFLKKDFNIDVLHNLEKFPRKTDKLDEEYYNLVASAIESHQLTNQGLSGSRFFIVKTNPFFVGKERYYEITLQLAGTYATKYNRITAYTKENISSDYSVQIGYLEVPVSLWGIETKVKVVTNWFVSIDPTCINKLGTILNLGTRINSRNNEYTAFMEFLTKSGVNLVEFIDFEEVHFSQIINDVFINCSTTYIRDLLFILSKQFSKRADTFGKNVVRYLLLNLREETLLNVMCKKRISKRMLGELNLSSTCYPFERNPFISNLVGSKTSNGNGIRKILDILGTDSIDIFRPYLKIEKLIKETGEIYFNMSEIASKDEIDAYNEQLDDWERKQGYSISIDNEIVSIDSYENTTLEILRKLLACSQKGNKGQREFNQQFLKKCNIDFSDDLKKIALRDVFVNSRLQLIYGAAGTGKTTLMNYISNLMKDQRKLFLTKTHTAKQNLQRRIENPGQNSDFVSIDSFTKQVSLTDYDIVFIDECSTIDNRTMLKFLEKVSEDTFLVLAGDIYQIESIDFGNWFSYAKEIINTPGSNIELLNTWRTEDKNLISLWDEVRKKGTLITEKLAMNGPFSEDICEKIFTNREDDEVVLCLNYDGKFGLNNMNNYFQNENKNKEVSWCEWNYKIGDFILFNESQRFAILYNNLKGKIVGIKKTEKEIVFTIDVATNLTEKSCRDDGIEFISAGANSTRISFSVYANGNNAEENNDELRKMSIVPFQLAYAVSIHKAQGLEYDSVKVIIPKSCSERISHGIFYTAITRAKKKLKIFWSSEIMEDVIAKFSSDKPIQNSLEIIRKKLTDK